MEYVVCPACRRHVREARCPFCGADVPRAAGVRMLVGRITRAAILYGASLSACSVEPAASAPIDLGAPMQPIDPSTIVRQEIEAPVEVVMVMPESDEDAARERAHAERLKHPPRPVPMPQPDWRCCLPYGAPAFDFIA